MAWCMGRSWGIGMVGPPYFHAPTSKISVTAQNATGWGVCVARQSLREDGGEEEHKVYIGQSENAAERVKQHVKEKEWWERACIITCKEDWFTATQAALFRA